eukprot:PITA_05685
MMGTYTLTDHFFVVDIPDTNMILGVQWLITLGKVTMDWKTLEIEWEDEKTGRHEKMRGQHTYPPQTVLAHRMEEQQFYAKLSKCEFALTEMLYLGHIIGVDGVRVHEEKIRAIREWLEPRNVTELRGFIGICTYYRTFVKGFSQLAAPLTDLTKKGAFNW